MARREFPRAVRIAVIKRATIAGVIRCEECHGEATRHEIDHVNPDALTGEPTLTNAMLLCRSCHAEKTKADVANIARAKRREAKHLGADEPEGAIRSKPGKTRGSVRRPIEKFAGLPLPPLMRG